ncbi:hypothetical protein BDB00DRAFT_927842 [Zychaea mexicana]|uniref:uncharacterized protein n=1 Tax=Zychaea mexicana TaxID=64656 RepID=UPI0022FE3EFD|nr:uncharacterized protein BDB00DRAFT_927842 [Zychaea mexicana]KAI9494898.1 hypothetical protein BDB00DRAFT_927842 [Zychaea mexicana]
MFTTLVFHDETESFTRPDRPRQVKDTQNSVPVEDEAVDDHAAPTGDVVVEEPSAIEGVASTDDDSTRRKVVPSDQQDIYILEAVMDADPFGKKKGQKGEAWEAAALDVNTRQQAKIARERRIKRVDLDSGFAADIPLMLQEKCADLVSLLNSNGRRRADEKREKEKKPQLKTKNEQTLEAAALSSRCGSRKRDKGKDAAGSDDVVNVDGCNDDMSFDKDDFIEAEMSRIADKEERDLEKLRSQRAQFVKAAKDVDARLKHLEDVVQKQEHLIKYLLNQIIVLFNGGGSSGSGSGGGA